MKENIEAQILLFRSTLQTAINEQEKADGIKQENFTVIEVMMGQKYARIVKSFSNGNCQNVYGFIDLETGDLLKAASWKVPAKGARGNIYNEKMLAGCCRYGMAYANSYNARPLEEVETE